MYLNSNSEYLENIQIDEQVIEDVQADRHQEHLERAKPFIEQVCSTFCTVNLPI